MERKITRNVQRGKLRHKLLQEKSVKRLTLFMPDFLVILTNRGIIWK